MGAMDFDELMVQARAALDALAKGDPNGYKALYSRADDITLGIHLVASAAASRLCMNSSSERPRTTATGRPQRLRP